MDRYNERLSFSASNLSSIPPVADSTHIGNLQKFPWGVGLNASGIRNISVNLPENNKSPPSRSMSNIIIDPKVYTDVQSRGLASRIVKYHDNSTKLNRSLSLTNLYNKPGQFPVVHLKKTPLPYISSRSQMNVSKVKIAPPVRSIFQANSRTSILRSCSTIGIIENSLEKKENENRPIVHVGNDGAVPTRSVLDVLKEISRKRINSDDVDESVDGIKKYCREENIDGVLEVTTGNETRSNDDNQESNSIKRQREANFSPKPTSNSDSDKSPEQVLTKRRMIAFNNDIKSSLSSSLSMTTPKRKFMVEDDISSQQQVKKSQRQKSPDIIKEGELKSESLKSSLSQDHNSLKTAAPLRSCSSETVFNNYQVQKLPLKPKITLFNKNYSNDDVKEHTQDPENNNPGISFVKPKSCKNFAGPSSLKPNPLIERTQKSKLALMLKSLRGELNDEDEVDLPSKSDADSDKLKQEAALVGSTKNSIVNSSQDNILKPNAEKEIKEKTNSIKTVVSEKSSALSTYKLPIIPGLQISTSSPGETVKIPSVMPVKQVTNFDVSTSLSTVSEGSTLFPVSTAPALLSSSINAPPKISLDLETTKVSTSVLLPKQGSFSEEKTVGVTTSSATLISTLSTKPTQFEGFSKFPTATSTTATLSSPKSAFGITSTALSSTNNVGIISNTMISGSTLSESSNASSTIQQPIQSSSFSSISTINQPPQLSTFFSPTTQQSIMPQSVSQNAQQPKVFSFGINPPKDISALSEPSKASSTIQQPIQSSSFSSISTMNQPSQLGTFFSPTTQQSMPQSVSQNTQQPNAFSFGVSSPKEISNQTVQSTSVIKGGFAFNPPTENLFANKNLTVSENKNVDLRNQLLNREREESTENNLRANKYGFGSGGQTVGNEEEPKLFAFNDNFFKFEKKPATEPNANAEQVFGTDSTKTQIPAPAFNFGGNSQNNMNNSNLSFQNLPNNNIGGNDNRSDVKPASNNTFSFAGSSNVSKNFNSSNNSVFGGGNLKSVDSSQLVGSQSKTTANNIFGNSNGSAFTFASTTNPKTTESVTNNKFSFGSQNTMSNNVAVFGSSGNSTFNFGSNTNNIPTNTTSTNFTATNSTMKFTFGSQPSSTLPTTSITTPTTTTNAAVFGTPANSTYTFGSVSNQKPFAFGSNLNNDAPPAQGSDKIINDQSFSFISSKDTQQHNQNNKSFTFLSNNQPVKQNQSDNQQFTFGSNQLDKSFAFRSNSFTSASEETKAPAQQKIFSFGDSVKSVPNQQVPTNNFTNPPNNQVEKSFPFASNSNNSTFSFGGSNTQASAVSFAGTSNAANIFNPGQSGAPPDRLIRKATRRLHK